ncbi:MAG: SGNH/GDSL hydrolase family protein [Thermoanaerobaculales bacterium]|jgi:lysophospholipase L1-like esterase|nr:SGNH/GDSL hydrolase family protein [Thermoanaerobaculales bacterium]
MKRTLLVLCAAALLASPALAQVDFTRYVALGDSLTAGFASGSLMDYYQERSYPALIADQAGVGTFQMPLVAVPGLAPALVLESLSPLSIAQTDVAPPSDPLEYFYNVTLEAPYQNLGIPGADTTDLLATTGNIFNLIGGNYDNVMFDLILRTPQVEDPTTGQLVDYTALVSAIGQQPTFVTVWIGSNDVLGAVLAATPVDGITMTPLADFTAAYTQLIGALATSLPNAEIVVLNIFPDARWIPFTATVPTSTEIAGVGTVPFIGEDGPLGPGDYLTLPAGSMLAQGMGLPVPGSPPLPENLNPATGAPGVILRAAEIELINARLAAVNQVIAGVTGQFSNVHLLDIAPIFEALENGHYRPFGGIELTTEFLVGGIFSYDGFHPQNVGQAVVASAIIDLVNDRLGAGLPALDMYRILNEGGWQAASPFGIVCGGCDPKQAILTEQAFMQLYEVMLPELADRWQRQPPSPRQTSSVD